jgi:hypothetical protein
MKIFLFLIALVSIVGFRKPSATVPSETIERIKKLYDGQDMNMVMDRLQKSTSAFQKWRGFPLYYFDFLQRHSSLLKPSFFEKKIFCAGNPHLENFGFVFLGKPIFSINDLEHAAQCPIAADVMRLFIGHRLLMNVSAKEWVEEYRAGLSGSLKSYPAYLQKLEDESKAKKINMPAAFKQLLSMNGCQGEYVATPPGEEFQVKYYIQNEGKTFHKVCTKSTGTKRYIVFYPITLGFEAIELKPLDNPAPLLGAKQSPTERMELYKNAVSTFYGEGFTVAYQTALIQNVLYQRRPIWDSHVVIKEAELSKDELKEVILYQARALGLFHKKNKNATFDFTPEQWETWANALEGKWRQEFGE